MIKTIKVPRNLKTSDIKFKLNHAKLILLIVNRKVRFFLANRFLLSMRLFFFEGFTIFACCYCSHSWSLLQGLCVFRCFFAISFSLPNYTPI